MLHTKHVDDAPQYQTSPKVTWRMVAVCVLVLVLVQPMHVAVIPWSPPTVCASRHAFHDSTPPLVSGMVSAVNVEVASVPAEVIDTLAPVAPGSTIVPYTQAAGACRCA